MPKKSLNTHMVARIDHDHKQSNMVGGLPVEVHLKPGFAFEDGTTVKKFPDHVTYLKAIEKAGEAKD